MSTLLGSNTVVTLRHWVCVIVETKAKLLFALYDEGQKCSQFVCAVQVCLLCYWELPLFCSISNWNCRILTPRTPSRPPRPSASTDHTWPGESQSCNHLDRCTRLMVSPLVKKKHSIIVETERSILPLLSSVPRRLSQRRSCGTLCPVERRFDSERQNGMRWNMIRRLG